MRNAIKRFAALLGLSLFGLLCGAAEAAPSVSINPGYTSVGVNGTVQYSATVTGLSSTAVTWSVSGVKGATNGTITAAGLYKAPAQIPANGVTIGALASDNKTSAVVYVNVAPPGPSISAIAPNPLTVGQYTITVSGSGFQSNAEVRAGSVVLSTTYVNATTLKANGYQGSAGTVAFEVMNPGSLWGAPFNVSFSAASTSSGGSSSGGASGSSSGGSSGGASSGSSGGAVQAVSPASVSLALGATQQFTSAGATSWSASAGSISAGGLYTAPATLPSSTTVTIGATGPHGTGHATVTLIPPTPVITAVGSGTLPLGSFSATISGSGFTTQSVARLNGTALGTTYSNGSLSVSGFASQAGAASVTVSNFSVTSQPFTVQVGSSSAKATPSAARHLLQQGAFGPTPGDAAHVQQVGIPGWIAEQLAMAPVSNYNGITSSQGGMPAHFMTMAVSNPDQLRQRVAFALSQIFVTSLDKLIWNDNMTIFQTLLLNDAFGNYRQIMEDVTRSAAMGQYLDMANNAKADPRTGSVANENYARELMQLFTIGTSLLNPDGSVQKDANGLPIPAYDQPTVAEFARVFTGWTYAQAPGQALEWGAYETSYGPMQPYDAEHDPGLKKLLNGGSTQSASAKADLEAALDNIFAHPNVGPFVSKQLIQHLVKSNPSAAYVGRAAAVFNNNGSGVRGDMKAVITAILTDSEARANDQVSGSGSDGHLQEPALFIAGMVRAFGGQMNDQNYYANELASMGQDLFDAPSVFNYYSPNYHIPGVGLAAGEFQIYSPNNAMLRANEVAGLMFSAYQQLVLNYGPGTKVDLTPFVSLASNPQALVDALDLTLTRGVMPGDMKQSLVNAINADGSGNVHRVQAAAYLILTSSYYNVWQ